MPPCVSQRIVCCNDKLYNAIVKIPVARRSQNWKIAFLDLLWQTCHAKERSAVLCLRCGRGTFVALWQIKCLFTRDRFRVKFKTQGFYTLWPVNKTVHTGRQGSDKALMLMNHSYSKRIPYEI